MTTVDVYPVELLSPDCCYTCASFRNNSFVMMTCSYWCSFVAPDHVPGDSRTAGCAHYQPVDDARWSARGSAIDSAVAYRRAALAVRAAINRPIEALITLIRDDIRMSDQAAERRVVRDVQRAGLTILDSAVRVQRGTLRATFNVSADTGADLIEALIVLGEYDWEIGWAREMSV